MDDKQYGQQEIKEFLIKQIKMISYSNKVEFYEDADFEVIFQAFDIFNKDEISIDKLGIIFSIFRIPFDKNTIIAKHKLTPGQNVSKKVFLKVIKREYNRMVALDTNSL